MEGNVEEAALAARVYRGHPGDGLRVEAARRHRAKPARAFGHEQPAVRQEREPPRMVESARDFHHPERVLLGIDHLGPNRRRCDGGSRGDRRREESPLKSTCSPRAAPGARGGEGSPVHERKRTCIHDLTAIALTLWCRIALRQVDLSGTGSPLAGRVGRSPDENGGEAVASPPAFSCRVSPRSLGEAGVRIVHGANVEPGVDRVHEPHDFPGADVEIDLLEGLDGPEVLRDAAHFENGH